MLCCLYMLFLVTAAADVCFMNHQGPQFQLKIFFTVLLKNKKKNNILALGCPEDKTINSILLLFGRTFLLIAAFKYQVGFNHYLFLLSVIWDIYMWDICDL